MIKDSVAVASKNNTGRGMFEAMIDCQQWTADDASKKNYRVRNHIFKMSQCVVGRCLVTMA